MLSDEQRKIVEGWCQNYSNHVSIEAISDGIMACIENALELYRDGLLLFEAERYSRAMSLFVSAMEEVGKVSVLCSMARIPKESQVLWKKFWGDFRNHKNKTTRAFVHTYADEARQSPDLMMLASFEQYMLSDFAERIRQAGLYVDFHAEERRWVTPAEITSYDAELWLKRLRPCLERLQGMVSLGVFSPSALAIQRDVYGPLNVDRKRCQELRKDLSEGDADEIQTKTLAAHRAYWQRLVDDGILPIDTDIQILGIPLRQFIGE